MPVLNGETKINVFLPSVNVSINERFNADARYEYILKANSLSCSLSLANSNVDSHLEVNKAASVFHITGTFIVNRL